MYNRDNILTRIYPTAFYEFWNPVYDGLGRLRTGSESIAGTLHSLSFQYDMLSQLTDASISNISSSTWTAAYDYRKNGDMTARTINAGQQTDFTYNGNQMKTASGGEHFTLNYDLNGSMKTLPVNDVNSLVYNWDGKLRSAQKGGSTMSTIL